MDPDQILFSLAVTTTGEIYAKVPDGRESMLPGVLRIVADALDNGESKLAVLQVPIEEIARWEREQ